MLFTMCSFFLKLCVCVFVFFFLFVFLSIQNSKRCSFIHSPSHSLMVNLLLFVGILKYYFIFFFFLICVALFVCLFVQFHLRSHGSFKLHRSLNVNENENIYVNGDKIACAERERERRRRGKKRIVLRANLISSDFFSSIFVFFLLLNCISN